jgi:hypothetical protein
MPYVSQTSNDHQVRKMGGAITGNIPHPQEIKREDDYGPSPVRYPFPVMGSWSTSKIPVAVDESCRVEVAQPDSHFAFSAAVGSQPRHGLWSLGQGEPT